MCVPKIILLLFIFKYAGAQSACTTPDNKNGQCLSLQRCPTMVVFLNKSPKPFSEEVQKLVNKYVCTYESDVVDTRVCCPSEPIGRNDKDLSPPPPDVANHQNLKLLPEECGVIDSDSKIRGGTDASLREFPWMALLAYRTNTGPKFACGGTIINERYILTAAHCVRTSLPLVSVRVGEYSVLSDKDCDQTNPNDCLRPPQDIRVEEAIPHPDYSRTTLINDIALLRVSRMDLVSGNIRAVCLPVYEDVVTQNYKNGVVTGWGFTDPNEQDVMDKLQKVTLKYRNLTVCTEAYKIVPQIKLSYKQLCIGGEGVKDSCKGDSGGPFHVAAHFNDEDRYVQRGVVSFGHRYCGTPGFPGAYTKVAHYGKWILDNIKP